MNTPGGHKEVRFVDVTAIDVNGNHVEFYQVGKITQCGQPVAREANAIADIFELGGYDAPVFVMMVADERDFLQYALQTPEVVLLSDVSMEPGVHVIPTPLEYLSMRKQLTILMLWHRSFALRDIDIRTSEQLEYSETLPGYFKTGVVLYYLESYEAPVIEYRPSFMDPEGRMAPGYLTVEMYRLEGKQLVHKGQEFESWYDGLAWWISHNLKRVRGVEGYLGAQARDWYDRGGQLRPQ